MRKHHHSILTLLAIVMLAACHGPKSERTVHSTAQQVRAGTNQDGEVLLGVDVLVTDEGGASVPCGAGTVQMTIEISRNGPEGPWVLVDSDSVATDCVEAGAGDLALVLDNSGSTLSDLTVVQEGARRAVRSVLDAGGRVSLVRSSTDSRVWSPLTDEPASLDEAIDGMFVTNGWTALWDGVRMGNETLGSVTFDEAPTAAADPGAFCASTRKQGVLLFTDGQENNSAHQKLWSDAYPGDGIDTTLEDLFGLRVNGATTPIYTIGLGGRTDAAALEQLATATGGRYVHVDEPNAVESVLAAVGESFRSAHRVCTTVPSHLCGNLDVRVTHRYTDGDVEFEQTSLHRVDLPCEARAEGRVATILLTMKATETTEDVMMTLVANTVNWVSPVDAPRVLFVLDDFHHGELADDTRTLYERLAAAGYAAEYLEEPPSGIASEDVAGFDVIWMSNPGYPMDDAATFATLLQASEAGAGIVLQGDDMSWAYGQAFATTPLTRLDHVDNGVVYCETPIDNGRAGRYRVTLGEQAQPILAGIEGSSFLYGDDIDTATPVAEGAEVVAWATVEGATDCPAKPVITAFTPTR
ncbi:MAG: VWA domain-containing protein [Polyangiaceae bacterium]|nr:VWA domain-containing protein [Polyangiaceae bacterium]